VVLGAKTLEVEIVGNEWWESLLGPALIATAAVIAAFVAAYTANKRQREQLSHDRALKARDHLRNTLDDAVERVIGAVEVYAEFAAYIGVNESLRQRNLKVLADADSTEEEKKSARNSNKEILAENSAFSEKATARGAELIATQGRLRLRLGSTDPIVEAYEELVGSYMKLENNLAQGVIRNRDQDKREEGEEADQQTTEDFQQFMRTCEAWFVQTKSE
jgi:hypothetical protein